MHDKDNLSGGRTMKDIDLETEEILYEEDIEEADDDIYSKAAREQQLEDDEIDSISEAFMRGAGY